jgi:hypothetical protein
MALARAAPSSLTGSLGLATYPTRERVGGMGMFPYVQSTPFAPYPLPFLRDFAVKKRRRTSDRGTAPVSQTPSS